MSCLTHPRYKALTRPSRDCKECHALWEEANKTKKQKDEPAKKQKDEPGYYKEPGIKPDSYWTRVKLC